MRPIFSDATLRFGLALGVRRRYAPKSCHKKWIRARAFPAAIRCGPNGLSRHYKQLSADVIPRLSQSGWNVKEPIEALRRGERNLEELTRWLDQNERAVVEHLLLTVTELEAAGLYFNAPAHVTKAIAA